MAGAPQLYDRMAIGHEFVKYAKENIDCLTVPHFSLTKGIHSGILRNWALENELFRALYIEGKEQIGKNRLKASVETDLTQPRIGMSTFDKTSKNYNCDEKEDYKENFIFETQAKAKAQAEAVPQSKVIIEFKTNPNDYKSDYTP